MGRMRGKRQNVADGRGKLARVLRTEYGVHEVIADFEKIVYNILLDTISERNHIEPYRETFWRFFFVLVFVMARRTIY